MKVYTKIVFDWNMVVVEEESFEYDGPVALCGGSSGGGGSSGTVDYPAYMKTAHKLYMDEMHELLPAPNPFANVDAPSISPLINNTSVEELATYLNTRIAEVHALPVSTSINLCMVLPQFYTQVLQALGYVMNYIENAVPIEVTTNITTLITALEARLLAVDNLTDVEFLPEYETTILPRFKAGMRSINAVQMSTFVTGKVLLESEYASTVSLKREELKNAIWTDLSNLHVQLETLKVDAAKNNKANTVALLEVLSSLAATGGGAAQGIDTIRASILTDAEKLRIELLKLRESSLNQLDTLVDAYTGKHVELSRMQIVAAFEQSNVNIDYDEKQYRWDLENYQYLGNMLAAIGSGTATAGGRQTSKFSSALGGALSGAAMGASIGNAPGAVIGGIVGLGAGLLG